MYTCYKRHFNFLASVRICEGWFESHFVKKSEDKFSRAAAQLREREREREREIVATKQNYNNKIVCLSANNKLKLMEYKNLSLV